MIGLKPIVHFGLPLSGPYCAFGLTPFSVPGLECRARLVLPCQAEPAAEAAGWLHSVYVEAPGSHPLIREEVL